MKYGYRKTSTDEISEAVKVAKRTAKHDPLYVETYRERLHDLAILIFFWRPLRKD